MLVVIVHVIVYGCSDLFLIYLFIYLFILDEKMIVDKKANYPVKVSGIEILPNPVVSGDPANFKISATSGNFLLFSNFHFLLQDLYFD
jgi:hypothetical protein